MTQTPRENFQSLHSDSAPFFSSNSPEKNRAEHSSESSKNSEQQRDDTRLLDYEKQEEYSNRLHKLSVLCQLGVSPYPHQFPVRDQTSALHQRYQEPESCGHSDDAAAGTTPRAVVAGRLVLFRPMGKNIFGQLQDASGRIQFMLNRNLTDWNQFQQEKNRAESSENHLLNSDESPVKILEKLLDLGDLIGLEGNLFYTNRGELTLFVHQFTLLAKALLPLPDKHSGLHDKELRYRKRWLDLISHETVRETFFARSRILSEVRNYLSSIGFMEVETPILQTVYGGAEARPFETHLHALHQEMFLRISLELPLKKLIVGGCERIFEIGKVFRNEGIDKNHNPEFTLLEAYAAYADYNDAMKMVEALFLQVAEALFSSPILTTSHNGEEIRIDFSKPWQRLTMNEAIHCYGGVEVAKFTDDELLEIIRNHPANRKEETHKVARGLLIAQLFELVAEPHLIQPTHILDHPIETTPLCKLHRDPKVAAEGIVERFESFILGQEICNAYSELNDPILQKKLLEKQAARKEQGDSEAPPFDEEFVEAIAQGMPPAAGFGIGIDRLVMLFTHALSIRDVLYFPLMRPQHASNTLPSSCENKSEQPTLPKLET